MRTFEVSLNGKKLCTAGVGDDGVLTAAVHSVYRKGRDRKELLRLDVSGAISSTGEQVFWQIRRLRGGDEIRVRIAEGEVASRHRRPPPIDPAQLAEKAEKYLENAAKRRGWKIVKPTKSRAK